MNPLNFAACPSCGEVLQQADVFDQRAGFTHVDCACGFRTKPANQAGAQLVEDAEREMYGPIGDAQSLLELYGITNSHAEVTSWAHLAEGCLQRFLRAFEEYQHLVSRHGRPASPWHVLVDDEPGEGPRSGGGKATSGAGAQRKEGVQPPGDSAAVVEVQA